MSGFVRSIATVGAIAVASFMPMSGHAADDEIVLGQTMPYSGPVTVLSAIGKVQTRFFKKVNDEGGINGRKVTLISLDDAYSPPKAVEQTRRLVESDKVVAMFGSIGTATNTAVQKYLNLKKVPQLLVFSASDRFADPKTYPFSLSGMTLYTTEAAIYARIVAKLVPKAHVAVLYVNDDYGREYLRGFKEELGRRDPDASIVSALPYEASAPSVESQVLALAATHADVFLDASGGKSTSQAIRKAGEIGWKPLHFLPIGSNFVATILKPAGLEYATGLITATPTKTVGDPEWANDPGYLEWLAFMKAYYPEGDLQDQLNFTGWNMAVLMKRILESCGNDLSAENIMKQAAHLQNVALPGLLPGITVQTSPDDYRLIKTLRPQRFDGTRWVPMSDAVQFE